MRIKDNRHLNYSNLLQTGDYFKTSLGGEYLVSYDDGSNLREELYLFIDVETFEVVDTLSKSFFSNEKITLGSDLEELGRITDIVKHKNLVVDLRS
jgi:hypothetical protein